ncbi:MAG TPA: hypothetical protein VNF47_17970 [Streptosporangiaceae bacterium]|nr:hypothetical protein [Streptosporangiaceae bacterium]
MKWLFLETSAAGVLILATCALPASVAPAALAATLPPVATTSLDGANLISYANSDFEAGVADWVSISNATLSQDTSHAYLHKDSLLDTITAAGTSQFKLGASAGRIQVTAGAKYRVWGYVKAPAVTGRTFTWATGFFDSTATWIGWVSSGTTTLGSSGGWQYVTGTITAPANASYAYGSPRVSYANAAAGELMRLDEVHVEPLRAATLVGAHGDANTAAAFVNANSAIGPLRSDKVFYSTTLPTSFSGSICDGLPAGVVCEISYKTMTTNVSSFVSSIPADRPVILTYYQEPEDNTFSYNGLTGGAAYVAEFENQSDLIRSAAADAPNVFVAFNGGSYQYQDGKNGANCSFVPPVGYVDMYLLDHYENPANGQNVASQTGGLGEEWTNWMNCVGSSQKPMGFGEYGSNGEQYGFNPNDATTYEAIQADDAYLKSFTSQPIFMWDYWYDATLTEGGYAFTEGGSPDGTQAVSAWHAVEAGN